MVSFFRTTKETPNDSVPLIGIGIDEEEKLFEREMFSILPSPRASINRSEEGAARYEVIHEEAFKLLLNDLSSAETFANGLPMAEVISEDLSLLEETANTLAIDLSMDPIVANDPSRIKKIENNILRNKSITKGIVDSICNNGDSFTTRLKAIELLQLETEAAYMKMNEGQSFKNNYGVVIKEKLVVNKELEIVKSLSLNRYHFSLKYVALKDEESKILVLVYITNKKTSDRISAYMLALMAHLGLYAFLLQVFQDKGLISQLLFYTQMVLLIMCFLGKIFLAAKDVTASRLDYNGFFGNNVTTGYFLGSIYIVDEANFEEWMDYPYERRFTKVARQTRLHNTFAVVVLLSMIALESLTLAYFTTNVLQSKESMPATSNL